MHKLVKKNQTEVRKINDQKYAYTYFGKDFNPDLSMARIEGDGYKGIIQTKQDFYYYVIEGELSIKFPDEETMILKEGDALFISRGSEYEMSGKFKVLIINNPAFEV